VNPRPRCGYGGCVTGLTGGASNGIDDLCSEHTRRINKKVKIGSGADGALDNGSVCTSYERWINPCLYKQVGQRQV
jgi:hypothetical protein